MVFVVKSDTTPVSVVKLHTTPVSVVKSDTTPVSVKDTRQKRARPTALLHVTRTLDRHDGGSAASRWEREQREQVNPAI